VRSTLPLFFGLGGGLSLLAAGQAARSAFRPYQQKSSSYVGAFFGDCGKFSAFFLITFLNSSCSETPNNTTFLFEQNNRGRTEKKPEKRHIFCDEPRRIKKTVLIVFLNSPCYERPETR
jgi:hypothetical protein